MNEDDRRNEGSRRFVEQLRATQKALGEPLASGPGTDVAGLRYVYMRGTVLVPDHDADGAVAALNATRRFGRRARKGSTEVRAGLRRIAIGDPEAFAAGEYPDPVGEDQDVLDAIQLLNGRHDVGYTAAPNHVISITNVNMCPADEPEPTTDPLSLTPLAAPNSPDGPNVLIVDTGLVTPTVEPFPYVAGMPNVLPLEDGFIREYAGHGTFIAELLAGVAAGANVWVSNLLPNLGAEFDDVFGTRLIQALDEFAAAHSGQWPDIISLSAGSPVMDLDPPLPGLATFLAQLAGHPETLLVAAAGNNGCDVPFHPAALAWTPDQPGMENIVSVGALRKDASDRACFSDFGPWVRAYAPGERLVAGFIAAPLKYQHSTTGVCRFSDEEYDCTCKTPGHIGALTDPKHADVVDFGPLARWSGTSFATPLVAGMVARAMAHKKGIDAPTMARDLIDNGMAYTIEGRSARALFPDNYTGPRPTV